MKNLSRAAREVLLLVFLSALILAVLPLMNNSQRFADWLTATSVVVVLSAEMVVLVVWFVLRRVLAWLRWRREQRQRKSWPQ